MTTAQRTAIISPSTGLMVYDTDNNNFWFYSGSTWGQLPVNNTIWSITGNTATNPATNFIGTTDDVPLNIKVNNQKAGSIDQTLVNTSWGYQALNANTYGTNNTASGWQSLFSNTTGSHNIANGSLSLYNNTTGGGNIAIGGTALYTNITGQANTAIGDGALFANSTGYQNTALGAGALFDNTIGINNIAIGFNSGTFYSTPNLTNTIGIGNNGAFLNAASNQTIIGNSSMLFIGGKVNWGIVSDARIKNTIMEDVKGLDFIMKLRPVTYHISNKLITDITGNKETPDFPGKYDGEKIKYSGFLAQEVEQAAKAASYDFSGYSAPKNQSQLYTIKYAEFVVPLVKAMQEQQAQIENLAKQNGLLKTQNELLIKRMERLEEKIK